MNMMKLKVQSSRKRLKNSKSIRTKIHTKKLYKQNKLVISGDKMSSKLSTLKILKKKTQEVIEVAK